VTYQIRVAAKVFAKRCYKYYGQAPAPLERVAEIAHVEDYGWGHLKHRSLLWFAYFFFLMKFIFGLSPSINGSTC